MDRTQLARMVTIRLSPEGFKVEFEGAMWGRRYIDQAHRAMLRSFPKYLAEAKKKGAEKNDRRGEDGTRDGAGQGVADGREGEGLTDREERRPVEINTTSNEGGVDIGAVQRDPGPDGGAGQDDREVDKLLEKGEVVERPRHRRTGSRRA